MRRIFCLLALIVSVACAWGADKPARDKEGHAWWQHAVFYEIYPRSFADSSHDGIGDLNGITAHLDYLQRLGVDAIWLTPCYPSPQVDFGYDVSDYENIDPTYGTLADFDRLVAEAKLRGIRVIMDFVVNHTSDQHPWFQDSRSSTTARHRNWYIWRDGAADGQPPNNWRSIFSGSAWSLDPMTRQYYLHQFYAEQPDLNWRNPEVQRAMYDVERFWFDRGVAGFRLDAVDRLFEDADFRDNPLDKSGGGTRLIEEYTKELPENHEVLRGLRRIADDYGDRILIGETWASDAAGLSRYYNELQMPMDFMFTTVDKVSAPELRKQIDVAEHSGGWPVYLFSNHDMVRHYVRYGDGRHNDAIAKLMAALYLTLRGTPILYYGEEIGMENNDPVRREDVKDRIGLNDWPKQKGRDGERTPMQWSAERNAGFSDAQPWLPVPASFVTHNVAGEEKDPDSILNFYRRLISLRRENVALREGTYAALNQRDANVLSYLRTYENKTVLVALNMSAQPQHVALDLSARKLSGYATALLTTEPALKGKTRISRIALAPFGVYVGELN